MKPWAESFYNSEAWRQCRETFLESKGGLCERCSTPDNPVLAKIAHHKTYLTAQNINDPYISLSWDNLEALCQDCHNKEHHRSKAKIKYKFGEDGEIISLSPRSNKNFRNPEHRGEGLKIPYKVREGVCSPGGGVQKRGKNYDGKGRVEQRKKDKERVSET